MEKSTAFGIWEDVFGEKNGHRIVLEHGCIKAIMVIGKREGIIGQEGREGITNMVGK